MGEFIDLRREKNGDRSSVFAKSVPNASHGFDRFRLFADFFPQGTDMDINGPLENQRVFTQCGIDQFRTIERSAGLPNQCVQQSKLALG